MKKDVFNHGYNSVRAKVESGSVYLKSCYNCDYYYQAVGDKTEVCQNPTVLRYDMVVTETSIYCNQWKPCARSKGASSVKRLFKKNRGE